MFRCLYNNGITNCVLKLIWIERSNHFILSNLESLCSGSLKQYRISQISTQICSSSLAALISENEIEMVSLIKAFRASDTELDIISRT